MPRHRNGDRKGGKKSSSSKPASTSTPSPYQAMMAQLDNPAQSSLHVSVICNAPELVASLLLKGAQPNRCLQGGLTPLHCLFLKTMPQCEDYYPYLSFQSSNVPKMKMVINHLVRAGSRLTPDLYSLSPLTLSLWRHSHMITKQLKATASCSVDDIIQTLYFSMPHKLFNIKNTQVHSARLKKALVGHLKHGLTPHKSPIVPTREFLSCLSATNLSDDFEVYSSQLTSYLALQSPPGTQLFPGINILLQVSQKTAADDPSLSLENYFPLISSIIRWFNSHTSLPGEDTHSCLELISQSFSLKEVRDNIHLLVPDILSFIHALVIPLITNNNYKRPIGNVILFLKIVSDCPYSELIPRQEMCDMFHLFNRKQMVLSSLYTLLSMRKDFINRIELLDFAMSFMFNLNETIHGYGGTALHLAAKYGDKELIRYYLRAGISPLITDDSGKTFLSVLTDYNHFDLNREICKEFSLGPPYRLVLLCTRVYIRHRIPLKYIHNNRILLTFVIGHATRQECEQMCSHCYKKFYS